MDLTSSPAFSLDSPFRAFCGMTFQERMDYYHIPAASIATVIGGQIASAFTVNNPNANCGPVTTHHLFQAASISKPVFAVTALRLWEQGMLDLDTDINNWLKDIRVENRQGVPTAVTLRQILGHAGGFNVHGFPGYPRNSSLPTLTQVLSGEGASPRVVVELKPGMICRYSGGGISMAQKAIEDYLGQSFPALAEQLVFHPLSMDASRFLKPDGHPFAPGYYDDYIPVSGGYRLFPEAAAAGLWSTPFDLSLLGIELQRAIDGRSAFLQQDTVRQMITPQAVNCCSYGLGFGADARYFGHTGSHDGYASLMRFSNQNHSGMVVMLNSSEGVAFRMEVFNALFEVYGWKQ